MELYQAIRLRALRVVMRPDREYLVRKILRWYSKTFFTPLREVEEMPMDEVVQAYFEEKYAAMSEDELEREREELLTTDEQVYERIVQEEAEEAELFEIGRMVAADEEAKAKAQAALKKDKLAEIQHQTPGPVVHREMPEADLTMGVPEKIPEGITMTFVDDSEFEAELEGFGVMGQPQKP